MEQAATIPPIGWVVIGFIAILVFIVLMKRGVKFGNGEKSVFVGKAIDKRIDDFKKEIEIKEKQRMFDENFSRELLRKSNQIDEHLTADCRRSVRRIDNDVSEIFEQYLKSPLAVSAVCSLIKSELYERLDYNNMKDKLSLRDRKVYCADILKDIHNRYSTFYLQAQKLASAAYYPEWEVIEISVKNLIEKWAENIINLYHEHIQEKIALYQNSRSTFETEEYKKKSIDYPIEKNKKYLKLLGVDKWNC